MTDTPRDDPATDVALGETAAAATRSVDDLGSAASLLRELAHAPAARACWPPASSSTAAALAKQLGPAPMR